MSAHRDCGKTLCPSCTSSRPTWLQAAISQWNALEADRKRLSAQIANGDGGARATLKKILLALRKLDAVIDRADTAELREAIRTRLARAS